MKLKDIKEHKDKYCIKFTTEKICLIKKYFKINPNTRVFTFYRWCSREYFLCGNTVFIVNFDMNKDTKELTISSVYTAIFTKENIDFKSIIPDKERYTIEDFLIWLDSPCTTTEMVDIPFKDAIKFLQNYRKNTFKTEDYLYYVKRDNDYTWTDNFYAYDLKHHAEMKLYINPYLQTFLPDGIKDIFVEDLSGKLSKAQLLKCKKDFLEFQKKINTDLKVENYYVLELVKQCIQPIEKEQGWFVAKPFAGDFEFQNLWIDDVLMYGNNRPYFVITEKSNAWKSKKVAVIDFKNAEYITKKYYVSGYYKRKHWELEKDTLKRLSDFLNEPFDYKKTVWHKKTGNDVIYSDIKTNWQWLISEYNDNTGCNYEKLTLDLPMPDYTKLANEAINANV